MIKVLFVCHGNICRSPLAEFVFKDIVKKNGCEDEFFIASAATSREEIGNPPYPPVRRLLNEKGIPFDAHKCARQVTAKDYEEFDYIICMDSNNMRNIRRIISEDPKGKISTLLNRDVADPWYTGDFDTTYRDVLFGCTELFENLTK